MSFGQVATASLQSAFSLRSLVRLASIRPRCFAKGGRTSCGYCGLPRVKWGPATGSFHEGTVERLRGCVLQLRAAWRRACLGVRGRYEEYFLVNPNRTVPQPPHADALPRARKMLLALRRSLRTELHEHVF